MREKPKSTEVRIKKFISQSGICSRREADKLIKKGVVHVNGEKCLTLGAKIKIEDKVEVNGKIINPERKVYILLNKPKDFITTRKDTQETWWWTVRAVRNLQTILLSLCGRTYSET